MPVLNFSNVKELKAIPDGTYTFVIDAVKEKKSKSAGNSMLQMKYKVVGGEYDGSVVFDNLMLETDAMFRTKQAFAAFLGADQIEGDIELDSWEELVGMDFEAEVVTEVWEKADGGDGTARNRIGKYLAA